MVNVEQIVKSRINRITQKFLWGSIDELNKLLSNKTERYPIVLLLEHKEQTISNKPWTIESNLTFAICANADTSQTQEQRSIINFTNILNPLVSNLIASLNLRADKEIYVTEVNEEPDYSIENVYFPVANIFNLKCDAIIIKNYKLKLY